MLGLSPAARDLVAADALYSATGSLQETGRRLGLDRRTVKQKIDAALLAELRSDA